MVRVREKLGIGRPGGLLSREDWIYVLSLLVPLVLYNVGLKVVRILAQAEVPGVLGFLSQVRSEVLFNLGYALLWVGLFAVFRSGIPRWVVLVLFHLSAIAVAALATAAHFFYRATGSVLDYALISFGLSVLEETRAVVATETTALHWTLLSAVLFYAIAGPAVITRLASRDWYVPLRTAGRPWVLPLAACALALVVGSLSLIPGALGASKSFSRDAVAHVLATRFAGPPPEDAGPEIRTELAAQDSPADAALTATSPERRNVVMVFMETTRADYSTVYNPDIPTTPFMAEMAEDSLVPENAYTPLPHTSKSMTAANCGVEPPMDTNMTESEPGAIPAKCLGDLLGEQGYETVFFQSAVEDFERRRQLVGEFGYEEFYPVEGMDKEGFETANYFGYEDAIMLEPSREWLEQRRQDDKPFLATYLTVTAHHDYTVPERYGGVRDYGVEDEEFNRYLNTLYYQDQFLKELVEQYKDLGLYEDTIFVVMADHGEGFGEHGLYQHDNTIYNEGIKIPIIVHDPRRFEGGVRFDTPVTNMDVLPTVTELLGYEIRGGTYPGASMLDPPEDRILKISCWHEETCLATIDGDEKYIHFYGNQPDEYYDLSEDPDERNDISDEREEEMRQRHAELMEWKARVDAAYDARSIRPSGPSAEE